MAVQWPSGVNERFFGFTPSANENVETVEFESGKKRTFLKNSSPTRTHSGSLLLWSKAEEAAFWDWWEDTALSGSLAFETVDVFSGSGRKEYKFASIPTTSGDGYPRTLNVELEEE